jgi:hypothetical protein
MAIYFCSLATEAPNAIIFKIFATSISKRFPIYNNFNLFEIPLVLDINHHQVDGVFDCQPVVDVLVGGSQLHPIQVHADGNNFPSLWAPIHNFILDQCFCFCFGLVGPGPKRFLPDEGDFHEFDFESHEAKSHISQDHILEVVEVFVELELDVEALLYSHFHLHL